MQAWHILHVVKLLERTFFMDWLDRNRHHLQQMIRNFMIDNYLVIDNYLRSPCAQHFYKFLLGLNPVLAPVEGVIVLLV